jgi:hypothetical protein
MLRPTVYEQQTLLRKENRIYYLPINPTVHITKKKPISHQRKSVSIYKINLQTLVSLFPQSN